MPHQHRNGKMSALLVRALLTVILSLLPLVASAQALRVVARVNDDAITDYEVAQRVIFAIRTSGLQDSPDMRQRLSGQILRQMVDERLQIQEAKRLGLKATDSELGSRIFELERNAGLGRGQFKQLVANIGVPFDIVQQQIEASVAWGKIVRRRVRPQVEVSENEVDEAYSRVQRNVGKTESRVAEIFVPIDRVDQTEDARRNAERIVEQLRRGAPFPAVAQQFSQGAQAQSGGEIGWILPGTLEPALDAAIERLQPRQHSEPIRGAAGWHILFVIDRRAFAAARADDARLNLVQMTLPLPINASPDETNRANTDARRVMAAVRQCGDLHAQARPVKGASTGDLNGVRVGDLASNREMYEQLPKLQPGQTAGPFRVAEGLQVVALCSREGGTGLPPRDNIAQQILIQKLEAAARRYMRELRRTATIDYKQ
jgi:peptidyl-prolyl cis-trans isomerase SurA